MRIPRFKVKCQVCGGEGYGEMECLDYRAFIAHKDPRVCKEFLSNQKEKE